MIQLAARRSYRQQLLREQTTMPLRRGGYLGGSSMKTKTSVLAVAACSTALAGMLSGTAAVAADSSQALEEVLVTASKREAVSVQEIPYNISAVSGAQLEKVGIDDLADFSRIVPGLTLVDSGPNNKQIVIRGLAATAGSEQVSVYFDEIPVTGSSSVNVHQTDIRLYDVERIEVLRGPQGTLYGAGSQAGTVRYIMNKPRADALAGSFAGSIGTRARDGGEALSFNGMLNAPLIEDKLAVRAVGYYRQTDGLVDRPDLNIRHSDQEQTYGGRVLARAELTDATSLSLSAYYQDTEVDDSGWVLRDRDARPGHVREPFTDKMRMYNVTLEHGVDWGTFTATGSMFERDSFYTFDVSQFVPTGSARVNQPANTKVYSAEVRFASKFAGPLQFITGLYYNDRKRTSDSYGAFIDERTGELPADELRFFHSVTDSSFSDQAIFGEVNYELTDKLTLTGGLRWFELKRDSQSDLLIDFFGNPLGKSPLLQSEVRDTVHRLQASYKLTDDALIYVTYSQGFREGGENAANLLGNIPPSYEPDFVDNYELGWKSELFDRQLLLNGAMYYMQWQDVQVQRTDDTGAFAYTTNAGEAELYGVELEGNWRPQALPGFSLTLGLRFSDQKLTQDNPNAVAGDPFGGRKGDPLPGSSKSQVSFGMEQRFQAWQWPAFARVDVSYGGKAPTAFSTADPLYRQWGGFTLTNLRAGIDEERWNAGIYVRNAFNKRAIVNWNVQTVPGLPDLVRMTAPREIGLQFELKY